MLCVDRIRQCVPKIVAQYNTGMGGIDVSDQMTDHYAAELKTVKCWHKIVFHLIHCTATNAYICYKQNLNKQCKTMTHLEFLIQLVKGLVGPFREPRKKVGRPSLGPLEARQTARHFMEMIPDQKQKKCAVCATKRSQLQG